MFLFCAENGQARLNANRSSQQVRRSTETPDARQARLDADRSTQQVRRSTETPEARQARLDANRSAQQVRRSTETPEARQARLDADRSAQQVRRSTETPEARQARLQQDRQRHSQQRDVTSDVPMFEQPAVHSKMLNFHSKLASLEFNKCTVCLEHFPNLVMSAKSTVCARCNRDNRIPKLYSAANNMDPGPVPPQLQVSSP